MLVKVYPNIAVICAKLELHFLKVGGGLCFGSHDNLQKIMHTIKSHLFCHYPLQYRTIRLTFHNHQTHFFFFVYLFPEHMIHTYTIVSVTYHFQKYAGIRL